ncbi:MAG: leucine-rich repeat protein [Firmicutes bacterium]|nr:leucine-rich repeat protein [Bacillota bacterium]
MSIKNLFLSVLLSSIIIFNNATIIYANNYIAQYEYNENTSQLEVMVKKSSDTSYAVEGGNIYFNEETGQITGADNSVTIVEIPETINGIKVIGIGNYSFERSSLEEITIPDTIIDIGEVSFLDCYNLTKVYCYKGSIADNLRLYPGDVEIIYIGEITTEVYTESTTNIVIESTSDISTEMTTVYVTEKPTSISSEFQIKLGDYIKMGNYLGEDIIWRCVAFDKISGYDENGNPIIDSTDTITEYREGYLPLMVSDKIICIKQFDSPGDNISGSHATETSNFYYIRNNNSIYGSNYWGDSNIRCWLNSADETVEWLCGNPPVNKYFYGTIDYSSEAGFMTIFSEKEKFAIIPVNQKHILDQYEYSIPQIDEKGYEKVYPVSNPHIYNGSLDSITQNYSTAYSEQLVDKLFLLDVQQLYNLYLNFGDYYKTKLTDSAINQYIEHGYDNGVDEETAEKFKQLNWYYYLRTNVIKLRK